MNGWIKSVFFPCIFLFRVRLLFSVWVPDFELRFSSSIGCPSEKTKEYQRGTKEWNVFVYKILYSLSFHQV